MNISALVRNDVSFSRNLGELCQQIPPLVLSSLESCATEMINTEGELVDLKFEVVELKQKNKEQKHLSLEHNLNKTMENLCINGLLNKKLTMVQFRTSLNEILKGTRERIVESLVLKARLQTQLDAMHVNVFSFKRIES